MLITDANLWRENIGKENDRPSKEKWGSYGGWRKTKMIGEKRKQKILAFHL